MRALGKGRCIAVGAAFRIRKVRKKKSIQVRSARGLGGDEIQLDCWKSSFLMNNTNSKLTV